jgi:hypothetical protein
LEVQVAREAVAQREAGMVGLVEDLAAASREDLKAAAEAEGAVELAEGVRAVEATAEEAAGWAAC